MHGRHLTLEEREILAQERAAGRSHAAIARRPGCDRSTIWRELKRDGGRLAVWTRPINRGGRSLPIVADNVDPWVMGFKTERGAVQFDVRGGSRLEVLGGTFGAACSGPYGRNAGGRVSLAANTSGFGVRGDEALLAGPERGSRLLICRCPDRPGKARNVFIPLLISAVQAAE
jgi:hypothetical protein